MDVESWKKQIIELEGERTGIDEQIVFAKKKIQDIIDQHNSQVNTLVGKRNVLTGKIDMLTELVGLEKPTDSKKGE